MGEILIDFIGHEVNTNISNTNDYHRFLGGSPTNVAVNAARLGLNAVIVATCGNDGLGSFIQQQLEANQVATSCLRKENDLPTSVVFVSKSTETPDFIAYRQADCHILTNQLPDELIAQAKIFHTTCFALSRNPAQQTILNRAVKAKELGLQLSIDLNFSERIWPDRTEANTIIATYLKNDPLVKISEDDCFRFFGELKSDASIFKYFHQLGATLICLTKGKNGVVVSHKTKGLYVQEALKIDTIKDATGAGDAFWTGFLFAQIRKQSIENAITIAQKLAALKLQNVGALPEINNLNDYLIIT